eukprot:1158895-Pelagomonas_calceolata.AAC.5
MNNCVRFGTFAGQQRLIVTSQRRAMARSGSFYHCVAQLHSIAGLPPLCSGTVLFIGTVLVRCTVCITAQCCPRHYRNTSSAALCKFML